MTDTFQSLGLSAPLLQALQDLAFETPSPIQAKTIPILLDKPTDFLGLAQTGTGKTAAYGLPLLERHESHVKAVQGLVIVPTRELCLQVSQQLNAFAARLGKISIVEVYGGANIMEQMKALKRPTALVVATPGRLIDLIKRGAIRLQAVNTVVLDEADEMLSMGFQEDIESILSEIQGNHQTWLFSATMPKAIQKIVQQFMTDPIEVRIDQQERINRNIIHQYCSLKSSDKPLALMTILDQETHFYGLVFCRTKAKTQQLADLLNDHGYRTDALHGDLSQKQRERVMQAFRDQKSKILIATDVAARGIDVDHLTHIIHFDLSDDLAYYTHRSGRTARAGRTGISLVFLDRKAKKQLKRIEQALKIKFSQYTLASAAELDKKKLVRWIEEVLAFDESSVSDALAEVAFEYFDAIEGEDLLKKLIGYQLKKQQPKVMLDQENSREEACVFVNVGKNDRIGKQDLINLLNEKTGIKKKEIGKISLSRRHALVWIPKDLAHEFIKSAKGMKYKGRKIAVRLDRKD